MIKVKEVKKTPEGVMLSLSSPLLAITVFLSKGGDKTIQLNFDCGITSSNVLIEKEKIKAFVDAVNELL